jgi:hypothetical protein
LTDWTIRSACEQDIEPVLSLWDAAGGPPTVTDTREGVLALLVADSEAAVWLPALARALTGSASALPRLVVEEPEPAEDSAARQSLDGGPSAAGEGSRRRAGDRGQAKRRAARAAR